MKGVYSMCTEVGRNRLPVPFLGNQFLTVHGNLSASLQRFGIRESEHCLWNGK